MQERLQTILKNIQDWWKKFNIKQRILMIGSVLVVLLAIIILVSVFGKSGSRKLRECTSESEAVEVRTLLEESGIDCTITESNVVYVSEDDYIEAKLILGSNNISSSGYTLEDATEAGFTTTQQVLNERYYAYLESKFESDLKSIDGVKNARVTIHYSDSGSTIFSENVDTKITAILTLTRELTDEQAEAIGMLLATNVGSDSSSVLIVDSNGNSIYTGSTSTTSTSYTASQKIRTLYENAIKEKAVELFMAAGYNDVSVSPKLDIDFDDVQVVEHVYTIPDGSDEGLKSYSYVVDSEGSFTDASGYAGTESNDADTDYYIETGDGTTSTYSLQQYEWLQNETVTTTTPASGTINWDACSMAIVAVKNTVLTEEQAQERGYLEEVTWEEYKLANAEPVIIEIDDETKEAYLGILSKGSGISESNISILAYQTYTFFDAETDSSNPWLVLQIILAVLIAGALLFIVLRSLRPVTVEETEPELSVEDMLATTKQQQTLEDIDLQEKSETRKVIEKFVDENPEAVAALLRNWLNEGWG